MPAACSLSLRRTASTTVKPTANNPFRMKDNPKHLRASRMGQVYAWIVNRLQIRLFAAAVVFWLVGAALDSAWLIQLMGMCAFFALAVIPLRFGLAVVDLNRLTDGR